MRVIARKTLREFWETTEYKDSKGALLSWLAECRNAKWQTPQDIKNHYRSASFVGDRVVFNICGNKYRLVAKVEYDFALVYVKFIGTHKQYDDIDVATVSHR